MRGRGAGAIVRAMSVRRLFVSLVLVHAAFAYGVAFGAPATAGSDKPAATSKDESAGEGVACRTDAECPHLACGPCTPGTPITKEMLGGPECAVNPCLDASAVCSAEHRCEIGPRTRKNPAVWRKPPG